MGSNYKVNYLVDIVFCIDCTYSMDAVIDIVKDNSLNFYKDLTNVLKEKNRHIDELRVRVVAFRDYLEDGENAMLVTDFHDLPEDSHIFEENVRGLYAEGGGDDPEDALEALAYAIKSDWNRRCPLKGEVIKRRQIIVLWSDDDTHNLGFGKESPFYPNGMAKDFRELTQWWYDEKIISQEAKRLILYVPRTDGWKKIENNWKNIIMCQSPEQQIDKLEYDEILNVIANTI